MTTTSEHTGTTRYLAPELVASEENVDPTTESDVYALGCLGLEVSLTITTFYS
jgi:serine/threonine protein kinase